MIIPEIDSYDWGQAFSFSDNIDRGNTSSPSYPQNVSGGKTNVMLDYPIAREDIASVLFIKDGEPDGDYWLGLFEVKGGGYLSLRAGCDYTGWG